MRSSIPDVREYSLGTLLQAIEIPHIAAASIPCRISVE
jgi:hypothetical protein